MTHSLIGMSYKVSLANNQAGTFVKMYTKIPTGGKFRVTYIMCDKSVNVTRNAIWHWIYGHEFLLHNAVRITGKEHMPDDV